MSTNRFSTNVFVLVIATAAAATLTSACSKSSSSGGDKAAASASVDPANVALASADAPKAMPNSNAVVPVGGAGPWDHHCEITATRQCIEWAQADKAECDNAKGTYAAGPCVRSPLVLGTCVLATGTTATGEPAPVKRMLYLAGPGGAMKADNAHTLCDREQLAGVTDATHMWKDGPAARK